jgi:hypothetical protein
LGPRLKGSRGQQRRILQFDEKEISIEQKKVHHGSQLINLFMILSNEEKETKVHKI